MPTESRRRSRSDGKVVDVRARRGPSGSSLARPYARRADLATQSAKGKGEVAASGGQGDVYRSPARMAIWTSLHHGSRREMIRTRTDLRPHRAGQRRGHENFHADCPRSM